ncbi:MAG TPA: hypothetical protein VKZ53_15005 [Candidatus Angelobacter sp.]|nr:hypothetical protein [Candidatus Angelobacter sp.]
MKQGISFAGLLLGLAAGLLAGLLVSHLIRWFLVGLVIVVVAAALTKQGRIQERRISRLSVP